MTLGKITEYKHINVALSFTRELVKEHGPTIVLGQPMTEAEAMQALDAMQKQGFEFIPMEGCDNYNEKGRCEGHAT